MPGAFLAKAFVERMPVHIHTAILDAAVMRRRRVMITAALRQLMQTRQSQRVGDLLEFSNGAGFWSSST